MVETGVQTLSRKEKIELRASISASQMSEALADTKIRGVLIDIFTASGMNYIEASDYVSTMNFDLIKKIGRAMRRWTACSESQNG